MNRLFTLARSRPGKCGALALAGALVFLAVLGLRQRPGSEPIIPSSDPWVRLAEGFKRLATATGNRTLQSYATDWYGRAYMGAIDRRQRSGHLVIVSARHGPDTSAYSVFDRVHPFAKEHDITLVLSSSSVDADGPMVGFHVPKADAARLRAFLEAQSDLTVLR